jgi:hypothetical protein
MRLFLQGGSAGTTMRIGRSRMPFWKVIGCLLTFSVSRAHALTSHVTFHYIEPEVHVIFRMEFLCRLPADVKLTH